MAVNRLGRAKFAFACGTLAGVLTLSGCAMLDGLFLSPATDEQGRELWIDTEASKSAGVDVLVPAENRLPGREYQRAYGAEPSKALSSTATTIGGAVGGWGALLAPITALLTGIYAFFRGKKRINVERAGQGMLSLAILEFTRTIEDLKAGLIDTDADGKVSMDEIKAYVAKRGRAAANPDFISQIVMVALGGLSDVEKQRRIEEIARNAK